MKKYLCKTCGELKPRTAFYRGRRVCKKCVLARARELYVVRTGFREDFTCTQCGQRKSADHMSSYKENLCGSCHAANLLNRKDAAPEMLTCKTCGESKPKEMFERYSLTRCKKCAVRAVSECRRKDDEQ